MELVDFLTNNMNSERLNTNLILGPDCDYILFKTAIFFAESGKKVWFFSPRPFDNIPEKIVEPEKEVLKLITFYHLKECTEILHYVNQCSGRQYPDVIIFSDLDKYCKFYAPNYHPVLSNLILTILFDCSSVCINNKSEGYLIASCYPPQSDYISRLQICHDFYFPNVIQKSQTDDDDILFNKLVNYYWKKTTVVN